MASDRLPTGEAAINPCSIGFGMRVSIVVMALIVGMLPASARDSAKRTKIPSPRATYAAMPSAARISVQSDLIWATHYDGMADGEITDHDIAAIRAFQKQNRSKPTGILNPQEREILAAAAEKARDAVGWRVIYDARSGVRAGIPTKIVPQTAEAASGRRWTSVHGEAVIETFRISGPGVTLATVFAQQKKEPLERRVDIAHLRTDSFDISGLQGLKRFYVHAQLQGNEVRGLTVLYDQALDGTMEPLLPPIWSAFEPFAPIGTVAAPKFVTSSSKVQYGTGIVVSAQGHIITPRHVIDGCEFIVVPGLGHADAVTEDQASGIALLRIYGAHDLVPLPLGGEATSGNALTVVGIRDPQAQSGGSATSSAHAQLGEASSHGLRPIGPAPAPGFSGAAAIGDDRFAGMVQLKPQRLAGADPDGLPPAATLIPAQAIRTFLGAHGVEPVSGTASVSEAKASVVRVICVRK
jgi:Trypsin-like peptidase domain/Putative peptidoglycan binding domain